MRPTILALALALVLALAAMFACQEGVPRKQAGAEPADSSEGAGAGAASAESGVPSGKAPELGDMPPPPKDVAAPPAGAEKTEAGVSYLVLEPGEEGAEEVARNDLVTVHYDSWTASGKGVDSTRRREQPMILLLGTIPMRGFADGVTGMKVGEKRRLWIPAGKAFQRNPSAVNEMMVYDVELLSRRAAPPIPEDVAAPPRGAKKTAKGVRYRVLESGAGGKSPRPWDQVKVHMSAWTAGGRMFQSTRLRPGEPSVFQAERNLPGLTDALLHMRPGDRWRLWIPEPLAFKGVPNKPEGTVVYDVELLEVIRMPAPPPVPEDVAGPPSDAERTESGLAYKVLVPGTGSERPDGESRVKVHYAGWTTDGALFDTSISRGQPLTFKLDGGGLTQGWKEGLQLMVVGQKSRFWIPEELAYQGRPNRPQGMLVFDIELLEIQ